jgi:hypothetical protein
MITEIVWHYLITTHHGSHYDWHVWDNWYIYINSHGYTAPSKAVQRVLKILARGGI